MNFVRSNFGPRSSAGVFAILLMTLVGGCENAGDQETPAPEESKPIVQEIDRGPIKLTVTADHDTISIAERLHLRIEVTAEPGIEVTMPPFGTVQSQFQVRDQHDEPVKILDDDLRQYTQVYELDSFLSGSYEIAGVTVQYVDRRNESADAPVADQPKAELTTDPITVEVTSLLEGEFDPADFRDVKAAVELPVERTWGWLAWTGGVIGVLILARVGVMLLVRKYRGGEQHVIAIPPHEWAFAQLKALADSGMVEAGELKPFYYRLSEITRTYIELRFGLMAPERTTEEFLVEMRSSDALNASHQAHLGEFLAACDMVKYALYEPSSTEIESVFNAARDFVENTRPRPIAVAMGEAA